MLSACILSDQMVKRQIRREYRAVVCGNLPPEGTITVPIARVPGSTIMRQTDFENGEYACTHFTKLSYNSKNDLSYISLRLDTGRTHRYGFIWPISATLFPEIFSTILITAL